jgi:hypothetical protein
LLRRDAHRADNASEGNLSKAENKIQSQQRPRRLTVPAIAVPVIISTTVVAATSAVVGARLASGRAGLRRRGTDFWRGPRFIDSRRSDRFGADGRRRTRRSFLARSGHSRLRLEISLLPLLRFSLLKLILLLLHLLLPHLLLLLLYLFLPLFLRSQRRRHGAGIIVAAIGLSRLRWKLRAMP